MPPLREADGEAGRVTCYEDGGDYDGRPPLLGRKDDTDYAALHLLREKALALLQDEHERRPEEESVRHLQAVVERLRHQIATNEPLATGEASNLQVATLWGRGGRDGRARVHPRCVPGGPPGSAAGRVPRHGRGIPRRASPAVLRLDHARQEDTVISRALGIGRGPAKQIGLTVTTGGSYWAALGMSPFLHDIMGILPPAVQGASWPGCGPG